MLSSWSWRNCRASRRQGYARDFLPGPVTKMEEYCGSLIDCIRLFRLILISSVLSEDFFGWFKGRLGTVQQTENIVSTSKKIVILVWFVNSFGLSQTSLAQYFYWTRLNMLIRIKRKWSWRYQYSSRTSWFCYLEQWTCIQRCCRERNSSLSVTKAAIQLIPSWNQQPFSKQVALLHGGHLTLINLDQEEPLSSCSISLK